MSDIKNRKRPIRGACFTSKQAYNCPEICTNIEKAIGSAGHDCAIFKPSIKLDDDKYIRELIGLRDGDY